jgi:hypothetical protein
LCTFHRAYIPGFGCGSLKEKEEERKGMQEGRRKFNVNEIPAERKKKCRVRGQKGRKDRDSVEIPTRCSFVIEFIIPKFIESSTCFKRHTAHHQEL